jgi:hypothetical protein
MPQRHFTNFSLVGEMGAASRGAIAWQIFGTFNFAEKSFASILSQA